jgi:hypothetical protein
VHQSLDRLDPGDVGADEDRSDNPESGAALGASRVEREADPERDSGQRVAKVVDQISEQCDAAASDEQDRLRERRSSKDAEREDDRADALA